MSKRVQVLTWFLVFMMLFTCACTSAKTEKTGERNKSGDYKPECETSETGSTPPSTTDYTDVTMQTYTYDKQSTLEDIIELSKNCIGAHISDVTNCLCENLELNKYTYEDQFHYGLQYPKEIRLIEFEEPVLIEGVAFQKITIWADENNIVKEIEFNVRRYQASILPEEFANSLPSELNLPVVESSQILYSKMQLIYGKPDAAYDAPYLNADLFGWHTWVDGSVEFSIIWGLNVMTFKGNNTLTFGVRVIEEETDSSVSISDAYKDFVFEMNSVMGLTESDAEAKIESFFGIKPELSDITENDTYNRTEITYTMPVSVEDITFEGFQIHINRETNGVVYIKFFTDYISFREAKGFYKAFSANAELFTDGMEHEYKYKESDWYIYKREFSLGDKHSLYIIEKAYIPDNSDSIFIIEIRDHNFFQ